MIAATQAPSTSSGNAASATGPASATPASPFDAVLTLEALAATCAALDTLPLEGGGLDSLEKTSGADADDTDDDEHGGPLAFLVNLLNFSMPTSADGAGDADVPIDDALGGHGRHGSAEAAAGTLLLPGNAEGSADDAAAGKLLLGAAALAAGKAEALQDATSTQDSTAGLTRAAEMLAQAPRHAAGPIRDQITTPVHSPRWADDLGARVAMMVRGAESSASLQLTPVDLGPVEVSVTVRDSQATIHFGAAQAETRALLEASLPKLREMLAAQGFNLMDASVSQGFSRQARTDLPGVSRGNGAGPELEVSEPVRLAALGLLDMYA